jgi:hypothetical protein
MDRSLPSEAVSAAVVTIVVEEPGGGTSKVSTPSSDFEPGERGVLVGRRFFPWHRVRRFWWDLAPKPVSVEERSVPHVRLVLDDGSPTGEVITVPAELFEAGVGAVTVVLHTPAQGDPKMVEVRRLGIPWHRLLEYERIAAGAEGRSAREG